MRALWSIEVHDKGWFMVNTKQTLREARVFRDVYYPNRPTRIQKWVRPTKGK